MDGVNLRNTAWNTPIQVYSLVKTLGLVITGHKISLCAQWWIYGTETQSSLFSTFFPRSNIGWFTMHFRTTEFSFSFFEKQFKIKKSNNCKVTPPLYNILHKSLTPWLLEILFPMKNEKFAWSTNEFWHDDWLLNSSSVKWKWWRFLGLCPTYQFQVQTFFIYAKNRGCLRGRFIQKLLRNEFEEMHKTLKVWQVGH